VRRRTELAENTIAEIDTKKKTFHLTMIDGSKWLVRPQDIPTVATWLPTSEVSLDPNGESKFGYNLTNLSEGGTVKVKHVSG
jgi:hypothetical protein